MILYRFKVWQQQNLPLSLSLFLSNIHVSFFLLVFLFIYLFFNLRKRRFKWNYQALSQSFCLLYSILFKFSIQLFSPLPLTYKHLHAQSHKNKFYLGSFFYIIILFFFSKFIYHSAAFLSQLFSRYPLFQPPN